jgi:hypothetical protein
MGGPRSAPDARRPLARGEAGQATVELAILLPVLLGLVLAALQVGLVARDQVLLVQATREAARAAAVAPGGAAPAPAPGGLDPARLDLEVSSEGGLVHAQGRYRSAVVVPLLADAVGDVVLRAAVSMRAEWA